MLEGILRSFTPLGKATGTAEVLCMTSKTSPITDGLQIATHGGNCLPPALARG